MAKWGFALNLKEIKLVLSEYVEVNDIDTPFNKETHLPGKDWFSNFMKRQNLKLRKLEKLEITRRGTTADPFVVFGFCTLLKQELDRLELHNKPSHFWNLDESFLPSDPTRI